VNALKRKIIDRIKASGPISVAEYMSIALSDPEHGYYMTRDPLGRDFTTAPEVSQIFGELIGLFFVQAWEDRGQPRPFYFVELGPGRGTLMADMLRAARKVRPEFVDAAKIVLVEISPMLRGVQAETLSTVPVKWVSQFDDVPRGAPLFLVANEFFDALPIQQFVKSESGWRERMVASDGNELVFSLSSTVAIPESPIAIGDVLTDSILELNPTATEITRAIGPRFDEHDGVTLVIDYGYDKPALGDTLQAVKANSYVHPLAEPGEADLTAHVDFAALARASRSYVLGPIPQGAFLESLGINVRAGLLKRRNPERSTEIDAAVERLTGPSDMGRLFKAMTIFEGLDQEEPPGFDAACGSSHR